MGQSVTADRKRRKKKKRLPAWTHQPIYAGVRLADAALQVSGVTPAMRFMSTLGGAYATLPMNQHRLQRAIDNISWCFPEWDEHTVRQHAVDAYRHLFCLGAEISVAPRLLSEDGYARYVELGDMSGALRALLNGGPCLLVAGHCGNWELLGTTLALLGFPMHALYRPLDMKPVDAWLSETRQRRGLTLVDKFGASDILPTIVERGDPVGFIADQNAGDRGLFVPFFDRLASAYKTIGLLAMKYEAPIVCGQAMRIGELGSGVFRYRLRIEDVFGPDDWVDQPDPLYYITARYRRAIEGMVRLAPEQYLWMHRYWKSRPTHERRGRPFPDRLREKIEALPWMTPERVERIVERSAMDAAALAKP